MRINNISGNDRESIDNSFSINLTSYVQKEYTQYFFQISSIIQSVQ